jgi:hypothetical protein
MLVSVNVFSYELVVMSYGLVCECGCDISGDDALHNPPKAGSNTHHTVTPMPHALTHNP